MCIYQASFSAQATVIPIANWTGWYGYGLWVKFFENQLIDLLCHLTKCVTNLVFCIIMRIFNDYYVHLYWFA